MFLSIFELFKIGVGPSSSHTMGPMVAAGRFLAELRDGDWPRPQNAIVHRLTVSLHGSLAFTGKGHGTDRAVILGLMGQAPASLDPDNADAIILKATEDRHISADGFPHWVFDPARDLTFDYDERLPGHTNAMRFTAYDASNLPLLTRVYYSIGGGFVADEMELTAIPSAQTGEAVPFPFASATEMLEMAKRSGQTIAGMKTANEEARGNTNLSAGIDGIAAVMRACVERGLSQDGILPGGLQVKRRARAVAARLEARPGNEPGPMDANDWLSVFAMAVNEENAAGSKVVTAPTNGAAGVIPAVLEYMRRFRTGMSQSDIREFLLTAAAIGGIVKHNASISGAEVGCQGEVGSASAMAAAGAAAVMGGTPEQIENAAEIALEHHLGMTCDPVAGLVQVPCIERNAMGAVKAMTAASLAMHGDGTHFVPLDACIETMRQTGADMNERYKETSLGGLAVNVPVNVVEC